MKALIAASLLAAFQALVWPAHASVILVPPVVLSPGETLSSLPNGGSSGDDVHHEVIYDNSENYIFDAGLLDFTLRARVIHYDDQGPDSIMHLHPGLLFDYEIQVVSGSIDSFGVIDWSKTDTSVKVCGISSCGGSGANGDLPTSVSRSLDGSEISWDFGNLTAGHHSANLQIFSSAAGYMDPPAFFTDGSGNTFSVETVAPSLSAVPLPASAPMFGTALIALGAVGFGMKRKAKATA
ncbi:VPLPA-CTERM sorting domain-containing protein [Lichenifustis flavocetrariae]|uniref:VPLPA-CTERM sorting domain-containing protein n=1 Tax=Lichenifustis flavocetrariae TaxID=2949735 RepID=A0AA41Z562_9HYPH|nr:VPLPA-CTERM sorting domain-containing protein [Lichenifustis flavocetrariae]MCW6513153.1 VPLPA-CTERM sorting domain-containing protein [Lichenifustis flavocetrariae]